MLASVIVPFLNEERDLPRCVASLLGQTLAPGEYEIILIDNGSTDGSAFLLTGRDRVRLLSQPTGNVYAARNRGLAAASGGVIAFTDADCEPPPGWLASVLEIIGGGRADIVIGPRVFPRPVSPWLEMFERWENEKAAYALTALPSPYWIGYTNNMAFRRDLIARVGPFNESVSDAGDLELLHRVLRAVPDARMVFDERCPVTHLEIRTVGTWLRKIHSYGATTRAIGAPLGYHELGFRDRLRVYRRVCRHHGYAGAERVSLLILLAIGLAAFRAGRVRGALGWRKHVTPRR